MNIVKRGNFGQLEGFSCHDGRLIGIQLEKSAVTFQIVSSDHSDIRLRFNYLSKLIINGLREGNIVDRFYLWNLSEISEFTAGELKLLFDPDELKSIAENGFVLSMECSYGAQVYALIDFNDGMDKYLGQLNFW